MARGGTQLYCPNCKEVTVCRAVSPTKLGEAKAQRWYRTNHVDVQWFRRARECLACQHGFLTAELEEAFIQELCDLRERLAKRFSERAAGIRRSVKWLSRTETVPLELAKGLVRISALWDHPTALTLVNAPGHADRIYKGSLGWTVDFGANSFLVGVAIEYGVGEINEALDAILAGKVVKRSDLVQKLVHVMSFAVANNLGEQYNGAYPVYNGKMQFGNQYIDLEVAADYLVTQAQLDDVIL